MHDFAKQSGTTMIDGLVYKVSNFLWSVVQPWPFPNLNQATLIKQESVDTQRKMDTAHVRRSRQGPHTFLNITFNNFHCWEFVGFT